MVRRTDETRRSAALVLQEGRALRQQQKERALELLNHIRRNMGLITDAFFEIGEALVELRNNKLHVALDHASFAHMLTEHGLLRAAQANKLIAVAELVPRETAVTLGPEKSYALTRYVRVAPEASNVVELVREGVINGRPISDVSVREIAGLTRKLADRKADAPPARKEAVRAARRAQAHLRKKGLGAARVSVQGSVATPVFRVELTATELEQLLRKV